jgi:hypothetical protein
LLDPAGQAPDLGAEPLRSRLEPSELLLEIGLLVAGLAVGLDRRLRLAPGLLRDGLGRCHVLANPADLVTKLGDVRLGREADILGATGRQHERDEK